MMHEVIKEKKQFAKKFREPELQNMLMSTEVEILKASNEGH
jgi:hypothetical protein